MFMCVANQFLLYNKCRLFSNSVKTRQTISERLSNTIQNLGVKNKVYVKRKKNFNCYFNYYFLNGASISLKCIKNDCIMTLLKICRSRKHKCLYVYLISGFIIEPLYCSNRSGIVRSKKKTFLLFKSYYF